MRRGPKQFSTLTPTLMYSVKSPVSQILSYRGALALSTRIVRARAARHTQTYFFKRDTQTLRKGTAVRSVNDLFRVSRSNDGTTLTEIYTKGAANIGPHEDGEGHALHGMFCEPEVR
jgi:hypothetical protein